MRFQTGAWRRVLFILVVLCATVAAQAPSTDIAHVHPGVSHDGCCRLCHAGPLPFLHTPVSGVSTPGLPLVWLAAGDEPASAFVLLPSTRAPRAPPA